MRDSVRALDDEDSGLDAMPRLRKTLVAIIGVTSSLIWHRAASCCRGRRSLSFRSVLAILATNSRGRAEFMKRGRLFVRKFRRTAAAEKSPNDQFRSNDVARTGRSAGQGFPKVYPDAHCELDFKNPLQLLVATILSAQCTDKRVNMVTPALFKKYPTAADYARAPKEELENRNSLDRIFSQQNQEHSGRCESDRGETRRQSSRHDGELRELPGVGRKTANVVLGNAFGVDEGIVVDTHVMRLSQRLRLTKQNGSGKNRTGPDETGAAQALDELESLAHLAWTAALFCAQAGLSSMRSFRLCPSGKIFMRKGEAARGRRRVISFSRLSRALLPARELFRSDFSNSFSSFSNRSSDSSSRSSRSLRAPLNARINSSSFSWIAFVSRFCVF